MDVTKRDILRRTIKDKLTDLSHTSRDLTDLFQAFLDLEEEAWKPPMWVVPPNPPNPPPYPFWGEGWTFNQPHSSQPFPWDTRTVNPTNIMITSNTPSSGSMTTWNPFESGTDANNSRSVPDDGGQEEEDNRTDEDEPSQ